MRKTILLIVLFVGAFACGSASKASCDMSTQDCGDTCCATETMYCSSIVDGHGTCTSCAGLSIDDECTYCGISTENLCICLNNLCSI